MEPLCPGHRSKRVWAQSLTRDSSIAFLDHLYNRSTLLSLEELWASDLDFDNSLTVEESILHIYKELDQDPKIEEDEKNAYNEEEEGVSGKKENNDREGDNPNEDGTLMTLPRMPLPVLLKPSHITNPMWMSRIFRGLLE